MSFFLGDLSLPSIYTTLIVFLSLCRRSKALSTDSKNNDGDDDHGEIEFTISYVFNLFHN